MNKKHPSSTPESSSLDHSTPAALQCEHLYSLPEDFPVPESGYDHRDIAGVLLTRAIEILDLTIYEHRNCIEAQYAGPGNDHPGQHNSFALHHSKSGCLPNRGGEVMTSSSPEKQISNWSLLNKKPQLESPDEVYDFSSAVSIERPYKDWNEVTTASSSLNSVLGVVQHVTSAPLAPPLDAKAFCQGVGEIVGACLIVSTRIEQYLNTEGREVLK